MNANANAPRAYAYRAHARRSRARSQPADQAPGADGHLSPWADPASGALGWQALTASRAVALALAGRSGTVRCHDDGEWHARIPEPTLAATVIGADDRALWCRPAILPDSCALIVAFAPWTSAAVLQCSVTALPARGTLSVREVRMTTRMGRIVRYLVPEFDPS